VTGPSGWCLEGRCEDCQRVYTSFVCSHSCHPEPAPEEVQEARERYLRGSKETMGTKRGRRKAQG